MPEGRWKRADASERGKKAYAAKLASGWLPGDRGHPATSELEYTADELEFMQAVDSFKRRTGRQFPTLCELFQCMKKLGYERLASEPSQLVVFG